jgi:hypothetical protein
MLALPAQIVLADDVERRIADFWKRVDAMGPSDLLTAGDLGGWALNVIERDPGAGITVADFRAQAAGMQDGFDRAGAGLPPGIPLSSDVEARIARFWQRIDALGQTDVITATDLGQWAINVIDRDPNKRIRVGDFRVSTAGMQDGFDHARSLPRPVTPPPSATPTRTPVPTATPTPTPTRSATPTPTPSSRAQPYSYRVRQEIAQGGTGTCEVGFTNTGLTTWTNGSSTQLFVRATRTDQGASRAFVAEGADVGTQVEGVVTPGQVGHVRFTVSVPPSATPLTHILYVVAVLGGSVISAEGIGCYFTITAAVTTATPTPTATATQIATPAPTPGATALPTPTPTPTPVPTAAPTAAPPAATCTARADARVYKTAFVPIVPANVSAADRTSLLALVARLRDIFPAFWASATDCRSEMRITGPELLIDTAGTLLPNTDATDIENARAAFLQTHANEFDFVMYFPLQQEGVFDWWRRVQLSTARIAPTGQLVGHGRIYIHQSSVATAIAENYIPVMLHEFHHQWCCYVTTPAGYGLASDYLAPASAGGHWSAWINFPSQPKYTIIWPSANGWGWTANADGTYTLDCGFPSVITPSKFAYPKFALWLMGLVPRSDVPALEVLVGPDADPTSRCTGAPSVVFSGLTKVTIPITAIAIANPYLATGP